jgi:hypothetical protein
MHGNGPAGPPGDGIACLDALAAQMHARGWSAYITTPAGRLASLFVQDPQDRAECGDIIAARDATTGSGGTGSAGPSGSHPPTYPPRLRMRSSAPSGDPPTIPRSQGPSPAGTR